MTPTQIADDAIGLFLEYRDQHGYDEDIARAKAVADVADAQAMGVLDNNSHGAHDAREHG